MTARAIPVLLSRVVAARAAELEGDDGAPAVAPLAVWANVLRCLDDHEDAAGVASVSSERDLATAARISKRLAVAAVTAAARHGWVTASPGTRGRDVVLTEAGRATCEVWRQRMAADAERWAGSKLRSAAEALVAQLPFELPWFPASYGSADPSAIGGSFVPAKPDQDIPAHGQDWRPVHRGDGDTVGGVPLVALLSQALVAFAIDYEARPMWPLSSTTLVVRHLGADPSPLADVPGDHGITGNGKSLLERHGVALVSADPADPRRKLVRLTALGLQIATHHDRFVAEVEAAWRDRYGDSVVTDLRRALEAEPAADDDRLPDHVMAPLHR